MKKSYNEIMIVLNYLLEKTDRPISIDRMKIATKRAFDDRNLKGIMQAKRDINAWVASLSSEDKSTIRTLLKEDIGEVPKEVYEVVSRRKINNVIEYRILSDALSDYDFPNQILETINEMLDSYKGAHEDE